MAAVQSAHRLVTYSLFAVLIIAGLVLEKSFHEMHVSKLLYFAAIGVWAREFEGTTRWALLAMVGLLWVMILGSWFAFRNQHLVPLGHGAYRIEN